MAGSSSITKIETGHEDLIHDVAYDFYGKRLITCSSDQRIKIWDFVERDDRATWEPNDSWKAHDASILKVAWAHPEYGQIFASCSFDRQVKIWEEQVIEPKNSQKRWGERYRLVESRGAVLDIAFSPTHGALRLAACSADGAVRIYEALDPSNLSQWTQLEEFHISPQQQAPHASQLPAQPQLQLPQHAIQQGSQQQPTYTNSTSSSGSSTASHPNSSGLGGTGIDIMTPANGPGYSPLTPGVNPSPNTTGLTGISGMNQAGSTSTTATGGTLPGHRPVDVDSGYCFDWCPNRTATPMMVVGLGKEVGARIFKHDGHGRWYPAEYLTGHTQEVHDVSWAPSMARSYQLIATASKDHFVRIYKLTEIQPTTAALVANKLPHHGPGTTSTRLGHRPMHIELVASFKDHDAEVWRVEWNVTGTILSSSGDDGKLRLWKMGTDGQWRQLAVLAANQARPPFSV